MMKTTIAAVAATLTFAALPVSAADAPEAAAPAAATMVAQARAERPLTRPAVLPALYVSYAALQGYDVYSTRQALARGAQEANPLMQGAAGNPGAMIALKASVAAGTILAAERLWKNDKKAAAIGVMVASNLVASLVASRNAATLRHIR